MALMPVKSVCEISSIKAWVLLPPMPNTRGTLFLLVSTTVLMIAFFFLCYSYTFTSGTTNN